MDDTKTKPDDGGPAFTAGIDAGGVTVRDYFATEIAGKLLDRFGESHAIGFTLGVVVAEHAYVFADLMIERRKR